MKINGCDVKVTVEEGKDHYSYFACICDEKDEEFWDSELTSYVEGGNKEGVVSGMIMHLEHYFNTAVTGIGADMWFGISLENCKQSFYIQCDRVEHGLLTAIKILDEVYEPESQED